MTQVGVLREIKKHEYRVGMTPAGVHELAVRGHRVAVEKGAGNGAGFSDQDYRDAGAEILEDAQAVLDASSLIIKVKEPQRSERQQLGAHHTLFTYLHLAPDQEQTRDLMASGATCIAYETVTDEHGHLPLLTPMSEVAGRLSIQAGAAALELERGGRGVLLAGVPGTPPGEVLIIGGGVVGRNAARMALGLGARVTVLDKSLRVLRELDESFSGRVETRFATAEALQQCLRDSDLVVGAVLIPGAQAPKLITRELLRQMRPGAALVDVAIDQGGCAETSRPTTHDKPTFVEEGVVHYCVANMPGAVARTSTLALTNATLPYILRLADNGVKEALKADHGFLEGLNVIRGEMVCKEVAEAQNLTLGDRIQLLEMI
ncbi:alanine dehydrogenase [Marinobacteraceae bacterium S3BR75-40.1]